MEIFSQDIDTLQFVAQVGSLIGRVCAKLNVGGLGEKVVWWENVAHADMPSRDWELIIWASRAGEKDTEKKKKTDPNLKDTLLLHEMSWQENQAKIFLPWTF